MNGIYDLLGRKQYDDKMLHVIPPAQVIQRGAYVLSKVKGRTVLDIGASGKLHEAIKQAALMCYGIDIQPCNEKEYFQLDIDKASEFPDIDGIQFVVAGEVMEHLSNAGHFLDMLKKYQCPVILTVPNAFCSGGYNSIQKGVEMVNPEHVAYYSYWTLKTLVQKHGYKILEWYWYNGKPLTAEGIIFLME